MGSFSENLELNNFYSRQKTRKIIALIINGDPQELVPNSEVIFPNLETKWQDLSAINSVYSMKEGSK